MSGLRSASVWLNLLTRLVAIGGLIYEVLADKLRNPTALVVFGGLAGMPDILNYREREKERSNQRQPREPEPNGGDA